MWGKTALRLLTAVLFLFAADAGIIIADRLAAEGSYVEIGRRSARIMAASARNCDWLILGDSTAHSDIDGEALLKPLGGTLLNLGTTADLTLVHQAWLLERFAALRTAPVRGVIVVNSPLLWRHSIDLAFSDAAAPVDWLESDRLDPPIEPLSTTGITALLLRWVRLYSGSEFLSLWAGVPALPRLGGDKRSFARIGWGDAIPPETERAAQAMTETAVRYGFKLYFVETPVSEGRLLPSHEIELLRRTRDWLATRARPGGAARVIYPPSAALPRRLMNDWVHMRPEAAAKFSLWLGERIAADAQTPERFGVMVRPARRKKP